MNISPADPDFIGSGYHKRTALPLDCIRTAASVVQPVRANGPQVRVWSPWFEYEIILYCGVEPEPDRRCCPSPSKGHDRIAGRVLSAWAGNGSSGRRIVGSKNQWKPAKKELKFRSPDEVQVNQ